MNRSKPLFLVLIAVGLIEAGCAARHPADLRHVPQPVSGATRPAPEPIAASVQGPELSADADLADLLAYSALTNPGLEAKFNRWKASLERLPQVEAFPDPKFTYRYFIEEVETRVGAQRQSFAIAQKFPWFGKLALRGGAAAEAANARRQEYEAAKLKLFYEVNDVYYEYYYLHRAIAVTEENLRLLKHIESVARTRYKVGAGSHSDVIRAQVELGKLDDQFRSLRQLREPVAARLNAALNRPPTAQLPKPAKPLQEEISAGDDELLLMLAQANPDLKALGFEISRQKLRIDLAEKDYFPDVTLGVNYIDTAGAIGPMNPSDSGKDPVIAMVSVNLPIWWSKLSAGVREAKHRYLAALHRKAEKKNTLYAQLKMVLYRFHDAGRKINLYRDTLLPKARQSLTVTTKSFQAGRGSFIDMVDAQRILLAFHLSYERALADHAQRLAELEMIVGRPLPRAAATGTSSNDAKQPRWVVDPQGAGAV